MIIVRTAAAGDASALRALLEDGSFAPPAAPESAPLPADDAVAASQAFIAHDLRSGQCLATARLHAAIGLDQPRPAYHVGCAVHASRELKLFHRQRTLLLCNDHTGASELADVAASAQASLSERAAALSLVVRTALLWLAQQRRRYADRLIVSLPGVRDGAGQSPFWQGLGQAFHALDAAAALCEHGSQWKSHLAPLLPRHPVYASFLPDAAQAAIGRPHPATQVLVEVLEHEGLRYGHHVDIHDGGPILEARPDDLRTIAGSRIWPVTVADDLGHVQQVHLLMTTGLPLRAARVRASVSAGRLCITADDARLLGLNEGDTVRAAGAGPD
jgi:arginine N-succinyltransferase